MEKRDIFKCQIFVEVVTICLGICFFTTDFCGCCWRTLSITLSPPTASETIHITDSNFDPAAVQERIEIGYKNGGELAREKLNEVLKKLSVYFSKTEKGAWRFSPNKSSVHILEVIDVPSELGDTAFLVSVPYYTFAMKKKQLIFKVVYQQEKVVHIFVQVTVLRLPTNGSVFYQYVRCR